MKARIERDIRTSIVTLSRFLLPMKEGKQTILATLERPWRNNEPDISCIPTGLYKCTWHDSLDHPGSYLINDVPNRQECLLHSGNFLVDTRGCILPGLVRNISTPSVQQSKPAIEIMHQILGKEDWWLEIVDV